MFERFTDSARGILVAAQDEAALALGHNYIGTEHILLGLLHNRDGIATKLLQAVGVDPDAVKEALLAEVAPRSEGGVTGSPPFTPRAKMSLELSLREALQLGHNYIGPEHLLLGVMAEGVGLAGKALLGQDADLQRLRAAVVSLTGAKPPSLANPSTSSRVGAVTPAVETVLTAARARAGERPIGTHDLLVAVLDADRSAAFAVLSASGTDIAAMRTAAVNVTTLGTSDETPEEAVSDQIEVRVEGDRIVLSVENHALLDSMRSVVAMRSSDPRLAHHLGGIWQQINTRLLAALAAVDDGDSPPDDLGGAGSTT